MSESAHGHWKPMRCCLFFKVRLASFISFCFSHFTHLQVCGILFFELLVDGSLLTWNPNNLDARKAISYLQQKWGRSSVGLRLPYSTGNHFWFMSPINSSQNTCIVLPFSFMKMCSFSAVSLVLRFSQLVNACQLCVTSLSRTLNLLFFKVSSWTVV